MVDVQVLKMGYRSADLLVQDLLDFGADAIAQETPLSRKQAAYVFDLPERRAHRLVAYIARFGNTSAATIPILVDEMRRDGRLVDGQLVCFLALGAGLHWGSAVVRL